MAHCVHDIGADGVCRKCMAVATAPAGSAPYIRRSPDEIKARISFLKARRGLMLDYLSLKLDEDDMHGVQDAASDIREIDAKVEALTWAMGEGK